MLESEQAIAERVHTKQHRKLMERPSAGAVRQHASNIDVSMCNTRSVQSY